MQISGIKKSVTRQIVSGFIDCFKKSYTPCFPNNTRQMLVSRPPSWPVSSFIMWTSWSVCYFFVVNKIDMFTFRFTKMRNSIDVERESGLDYLKRTVNTAELELLSECPMY